MRNIVDAIVGCSGTLAALGIPADSLLEIGAKYGAAALAIGWFMWRDSQREKAMNDLLNQRHQELAQLTRDSTSAMNRMAKAAEHCKERADES